MATDHKSALTKLRMARTVAPSASATGIYRPMAPVRRDGFSNFMKYCRELASSVIDTGITTLVTSATLSRRKGLDLPTVTFDRTDIKKLADSTELAKASREAP